MELDAAVLSYINAYNTYPRQINEVNYLLTIIIIINNVVVVVILDSAIRDRRIAFLFPVHYLHVFIRHRSEIIHIDAVSTNQQQQHDQKHQDQQPVRLFDYDCLLAILKLYLEV